MNCWTWDFHFVFPWGRHWTNHDKSTICCSWNLHVSGYVGLFRTLKGNSQEWDDLFQFQLVVKHGPWTSQQQRLLGFNLWVWEWCVIFFCPAQKPEPGTLEPCNLLLGCKAGLISSTKEFIDRDSYESLADVVEPFHGCKTTGACVWGGVISACRKAWRIATHLFSRLSCTTQPDAAGALECFKASKSNGLSTQTQKNDKHTHTHMYIYIIIYTHTYIYTYIRCICSINIVYPEHSLS